MSSVADVLGALAEVARPDKAADWDSVGLQVGDLAARADTVGVCHEVTTDVVAAVEHDPVDLLVAYHPLLFRPTRTLIAGASPGGRAFRLARAGVALAVVHTAFDVAPGGAADALAAALGITDPAGFGPAWAGEAVKVVTFLPSAAADAVAAAMADAGAGTIGGYTACSFRSEGVGSFFAGAATHPAAGSTGGFNAEAEVRLEMIAPGSRRDAVVGALVAAHPYEEPAFDVYAVSANAGMVGRRGAVAPTTLAVFAEKVAAALETSVRFSGSADLPIGDVAVVPGSGSSLIDSAVGANVLVTGDVSHHDARRAADRGLAIIDAGHIPTERPGLERLYAAVARIAAETRAVGPDPDLWREP